MDRGRLRLLCLQLFRFPTLVLPRSGCEGRPSIIPADSQPSGTPSSYLKIVVCAGTEVNMLLGPSMTRSIYPLEAGSATGGAEGQVGRWFH